MSYLGLLGQTARHLRPIHDASGNRSFQVVREGVRVRVDREVLSLETIPLESGTVASGAHVAYLEGPAELWKDGDYIEVGGITFEILSTSAVVRNIQVVQATVTEKGIV